MQLNVHCQFVQHVLVKQRHYCLYQHLMMLSHNYPFYQLFLINQISKVFLWSIGIFRIDPNWNVCTIVQYITFNNKFRQRLNMSQIYENTYDKQNFRYHFVAYNLIFSFSFQFLKLFLCAKVKKHWHNLLHTEMAVKEKYPFNWIRFRMCLEKAFGWNFKAIFLWNKQYSPILYQSISSQILL